MISGFTIVRNASILQYPFLESVRSLAPLCDEVLINCGASDDNTRELCAVLEKEFPEKVRVIESTWEKKDQKAGYQLKAQTDAILRQCKNPWCFYIQADEVLHEEDYALIQEARLQAEKKLNIDGVVFNYLHFYGSYNYGIRGRNWYRREVRLFKNHRGITAFRDAQGFRKDGRQLKAILSKARVFHYGYVRPPESLSTKAQHMDLWWGKNIKAATPVPLTRHFGLYRFKQTHPRVMAERIGTYDFKFNPKDWPRKWDKNEIKNLITLLWESIFPWRLGEFRNYRF